VAEVGQHLLVCMKADAARKEESSLERVAESEAAAPDAEGRMGMFAAEVADGAYAAGMDTTAVHTEERIAVLDLPCADGNTLDMTAAVSCLVALENNSYHAVSQMEAWASGRMAACLKDDGS